MSAPPNWVEVDGALEREFELPSFPDAIAFVNRVAEAANTANHHPDIHLEAYKTVRIVLTTHVAHGLTDADVDLARRINSLETT